MKRSLLCALFSAALLFSPTTVLAQTSDHDAVDQVMQKMLRGFEAGDPALIFEVLRKDGVVVGYSPAAGRMVTQTTEEWAKGFTGEPATDEAQRKRSYRILDVTPHAAQVKLTLDYPGWDGEDYLALLNIDGKWMIVSKSWSGQRKSPAS